MHDQNSKTKRVPQIIDRNILDNTIEKALASDRKRMNHNFHQPEDTIQRFLNAIEPESYIRPHRHINPLKDEIFLVLIGKGAVFVFDEEGRPQSIHLLDPSLGYWGIDIPGGLYHTIVSSASGSVFFEVKQGPYDPDAAKHFAPWSPEAGTDDAESYLKNLHREIANYRDSLGC